MARLRIFVDHANIDCSWKSVVKSPARIAWEKLPSSLIERLSKMDYIGGAPIDLRGVTVYASIHPAPTEHDLEYEHFLKYKLDQMPGYTVKFSVRRRREEICEQGHRTTHYIEKGVDTKIACDMMALAARDSYDIGIIISDDEDLVPSVECAQEVLDRQIIHVGFKRHGAEIRSAAWGHILLDDMVAGLSYFPKPKAVA